ncbi:DUF4424 domain-containing protein [Beijerinckia sp. L45]|uniref:DUF4424 domain-containing protein n=1 Tax=Beijerinckia sp. L45 TaxID=1641855 RepID=UPI00131D9697|nr:DUF4424 domain-containing protein [Beijerinckia sp. L45]
MARLIRVIATGAAVLLAGSAQANDTTAEFAIGGLRFTADSDIAMRAEDLFISTEAVRIAYTFRNQSSADKTVTIAFPMPDIVGATHDEEVGLPTENADNLFDFHVAADGHDVALALDQTALANNIDQTARLREAHIPLMPLAAATNAALDRLPAATQAAFVKLGLASVEEYTDKPDGPMEKHLAAAWTLRSAFTWRQTFPAGRDLHLDQHYKPSVGGSAQTIIGTKGWRANEETPAYLKKYCIDRDLVASIERAMTRQKLDYPPFGEQRIAYVLKTGANWAGPIGDFHLTIDKGAAANLLSVCADGVTKTGPTLFEVHRTDFVPKEDLYILLFVPLS